LKTSFSPSENQHSLRRSGKSSGRAALDHHGLDRPLTCHYMSMQRLRRVVNQEPNQTIVSHRPRSRLCSRVPMRISGAGAATEAPGPAGIDPQSESCQSVSCK
jgi:hypothetical protein